MPEHNNTPPLPKGWRWVRLGEVTRVASGSTPRSGTEGYWDGDIVWITPTDLGKLSSKEILTSDRRITKAGYESCGTELVPPGSVVMSSRAPIGHLGIARVPLCTNQGCKSFVPGATIDSEFLYFSLKQNVPTLQAIGSGATFSEVSKTTVEGFEVPLPPLEEQKRIAAILNEQMAALERARAAAEAQLEAAKALPAGYLRAVFSSPEAHKWPQCPVGEVAKVQSGYAFKSEWFSAKGIRLLRNANVLQGYVDWGDEVRLPEERRHEFSSFELYPGDIVLSLDRPLVNKGLKVARLSEKDTPALLLQRVARFRLSDTVCPDYLYSFIKSQRFVTAITQHDQSLGVPHVSPLQVEAVKFPFPPLTEQERIAAMLNEQTASAERARKAIEEELDAINKLPAALLCRAFAGGF